MHKAHTGCVFVYKQRTPRIHQTRMGLLRPARAATSVCEGRVDASSYVTRAVSPSPYDVSPRTPGITQHEVARGAVWSKMTGTS